MPRKNTTVTLTTTVTLAIDEFRYDAERQSFTASFEILKKMGYVYSLHSFPKYIRIIGKRKDVFFTKYSFSSDYINYTSQGTDKGKYYLFFMRA